MATASLRLVQQRARGPRRDHDATWVKTFQPPALLLPVNHPFALRRWLVAVEFGCGDERDDRDLLQTKVDFAFAWLELPSPGMALGTRPAPRAPARPAAGL